MNVHAPHSHLPARRHKTTLHQPLHCHQPPWRASRSHPHANTLLSVHAAPTPRRPVADGSRSYCPFAHLGRSSAAGCRSPPRLAWLPSCTQTLRVLRRSLARRPRAPTRKQRTSAPPPRSWTCTRRTPTCLRARAPPPQHHCTHHCTATSRQSLSSAHKHTPRAVPLSQALPTAHPFSRVPTRGAWHGPRQPHRPPRRPIPMEAIATSQSAAGYSPCLCFFGAFSSLVSSSSSSFRSPSSVAKSSSLMTPYRGPFAL